MKTFFLLILVGLLVAALWPRISRLIPYSPDSPVTVYAQLQDSVAFDRGEPIDGSSRITHLARIFEDQIRKDKLATRSIETPRGSTIRIIHNNEIAFVDYELVWTGTPTTYGEIRTLAVLATDPIVLSVPRSSPYDSSRGAMEALGKVIPVVENSRNELFHFANTSVNVEGGWMVSILGPEASKAGGEIRYRYEDAARDEGFRRENLLRTVQKQRPQLLISNLSQVHSELTGSASALRGLVLCDTQPADEEFAAIPLAKDIQFDCPVIPFVAVVIRKNAPAKVDKFWLDYLGRMDNSAEWRNLLHASGLQHRFIVGDAAQEFIARQFEIAQQLQKNTYKRKSE